MTAADLANYIRKKTRTNSTTFPDADILLYLKLRQDELARELARKNKNYFTTPQTDSLVADQREYPFPSSVLNRLDRVEAKLDGSSWMKLTATTQDRISHALNETTIVENYANTDGDAFYYIQRRAIYILSGTITAVASGLKIWIRKYPATITDLTATTDLSIDPSTTTHGMPRELHELWARGVIIDYKESKEKPIPLNERERKYELDKQKAIETLMTPSTDLEVYGDIPSASDRWDSGFDL